MTRAWESSKILESSDPEPESPRKVLTEGFHYRMSNDNRQLSVVYPVWLSKDRQIKAEIWDLAGKRTDLNLLSNEGVYSTHGSNFSLENVKTRGVHFFRVSAGNEYFSGRLVLSGLK